MLYMVTFTINIPQLLAYIPYMDPMGIGMKKHDKKGYLNIAIPCFDHYSSHIVGVGCFNVSCPFLHKMHKTFN